MDMNGINNLVFKCLLQSVGSAIGLGIVYAATKALGSNVEPVPDDIPVNEVVEF